MKQRIRRVMLSIVPMFMCCQTGNLWFTLVSDFKERRDGDYVGTFVFYTLTHPDGKQEQKHIAIRNDNEKHIWIADGGL